MSYKSLFPLLEEARQLKPQASVERLCALMSAAMLELYQQKQEATADDLLQLGFTQNEMIELGHLAADRAREKLSRQLESQHDDAA